MNARRSEMERVIAEAQEALLAGGEWTVLVRRIVRARAELDRIDREETRHRLAEAL